MNSVTESFLLDHARTNLWCAPIQDRQVILDLTRISRDSGAKVSSTILWVDTPLPTEGDVYHLYQIGANSRWRTGLPDVRGKWMALGPYSEATALIIDLYLETGVKLPLFSSYVLRTYDDNLIIAIKEHAIFGELSEKKAYLRIYNNAFFRSERSNNIGQKVAYIGREITKQTDIAAFINGLRPLQTLTGVTNIYHNGVWKPEIKSTDISIGDLAEAVYDAAVSHVVDFKVSSLYDYTSTLDNLKKYLLHPSKNTHDNEIYYVDDIDLFMYKVGANDSVSGRYYHRNKENSLRNVTHADYSIPTGYVSAYLNDGWTTYDNLYIRLHLRESGFKRPLIDEVNRIETLYRLSDTDILRAMIGLDSTLAEWRVENLENSLYTAIMRNFWGSFTATDVINAYGYNALAKLFALNPTKVTPSSNGGFVDLPFGLSLCSTLFEYDEDGVLLGWNQHGYSERYFVKNERAALVEGFMGWGKKAITWSPSNNNYTLDDKYQYYFFKAAINKGVVSDVWVPAVEGTDYTVLNNVVTWIHVKARNMGLILSSSEALVYDQVVGSSDGIFRFTLTYGKTLGTILPIRPQQLRVWMNGHPLIEGLDYILDGNKGTVITNRYYDETLGNSQNFTFACLGWETPSAKYKRPLNIGFVDHGYVSVNGTFDIRDDKVIRTIIDGKVVDPSTVPFIEDADEKQIPLLPNGLPYCEETVFVPLYGISTNANAELIQMGAESDKRVSDYMTLKYPEKILTGPNPISERYRMFSVVITRLIFDLDNGTITEPLNVNDKVSLDRVMKNYSEYLDIDPCRSVWNTNYIFIDAHPFSSAVAVTTKRWKFLQNVNQYYLNNRLSLNNYFFIKES